MQKKVIKDLSAMIERLGYEALNIPVVNDWNTGYISIQHPDWVGELGGVKYTFDNCGFDSRMTFLAQIGGKNIPSLQDEQYFDFVIPFKDADGYENFRNILENEIGAEIVSRTAEYNTNTG